MFSFFGKAAGTGPGAGTATAAASTTTAAASTEITPTADRSIFSRRSIGQLGLFFAGATFLALSTTVTRRAMTRRQIEARLKFFHQSGGTTSKHGGAPSNTVPEAAQADKGSRTATAAADADAAPHGSGLALEALNLATLNVTSFFVMMAGGMAWALDLSSVEEMRQRVQRRTRQSGGPLDTEAEAEAERELEEFMGRMLGKGEEKKE